MEETGALSRLGMLRRIVVSGSALGMGLSTASSALAQSHVRVRGEGIKVVETGRGVGRIRGIATDVRGNVFILDEETNIIREYSAHGRLIATTGDATGSPAVLEPVGIESTKGDQVTVLDRRAESVVTFGREGRTLGVLRQAPISAVGNAFCVASNGTYVLGRRQPDPQQADSLIHEYAASGEYVRSFGGPFGDAPPYGQIALDFGYLVCGRAPPRVVVVSKLYGEVRAYRSDGSLAWHVQEVPFAGTSVIVESPTHITFSTSPSGYYNMNAGAFIAAQGVLAVQVGTKAEGNRVDGQYKAIRTDYYDMTSGAKLGTQDDLPLIGAVGQGRLVTYSNDSIPEMSIVPFTFYRK